MSILTLGVIGAVQLGEVRWGRRHHPRREGPGSIVAEQLDSIGVPSLSDDEWQSHAPTFPPNRQGTLSETPAVGRVLRRSLASHWSLINAWYESTHSPPSAGVMYPNDQLGSAVGRVKVHRTVRVARSIAFKFPPGSTGVCSIGLPPW